MSTEKDNHGKSFFQRLISLQKTMSAAEFCRYIGVSTPLFHKWKNGSIPGREKLRLIAERLNVDSDWLLTGREGVSRRREVGSVRHAGGRKEITDASESGNPDLSLPSTWSADTACHYPQGGALETELSEVKENMASMRADIAAMSAQLNTVVLLLGAALGKGLDDDQIKTRAG